MENVRLEEARLARTNSSGLATVVEAGKSSTKSRSPRAPCSSLVTLRSSTPFSAAATSSYAALLQLAFFAFPLYYYLKVVAPATWKIIDFSF